MEARMYEKKSVMNVVDLLISGKDSEVISILRELQQETYKEARRLNA